IAMILATGVSCPEIISLAKQSWSTGHSAVGSLSTPILQSMIRSNPVPEREEYMANSDSEYPLRQPRRGSHHDPFDDDTEADDDLQQERDARRPRTARHQTRGPLHQRELPTTPQLPPHHMRDTLIIGLIAGTIVALQR